MTFILKEMTKKLIHILILYDWNDSFRKIPKVAVAKGDSYYDIREQFAST